MTLLLPVKLGFDARPLCYQYVTLLGSFMCLMNSHDMSGFCRSAGASHM